ncbi:MAG TPA: hypothetical protein QGF41_11280, partial [Gammaproteobacteria bacterium]|nr:hypothetical protein [Gammaproteobacteria bacterium]
MLSGLTAFFHCQFLLLISDFSNSNAALQSSFFSNFFAATCATIPGSSSYKLLAGVLGKMTNSGSGISIRTYHNLTRSNSFSSKEIESDLGFTPASNLYDELPGIVAHVAAKKVEKNA